MLKKVILALAVVGLFGATDTTASARECGCGHCGHHGAYYGHGGYYGGYGGPYRRGFHRDPSTYFMPPQGYGYYYGGHPGFGGYGYGWGVGTALGL